MNVSALRAYRFGQFRVDLLRQQLTGPDGAVAGLSARAYDVLIYLLENRDRVVSKNELMKAVWPQVGRRGKQPEPGHYDPAPGAR